MDRNVKQMLKLIEDDGDSFAQKAEMYYQKRPELVSLVEEFHRGYRSLAERYEGESWRSTPPCDLQSQASGVSDNGSEPASTFPPPSPRKLGRRISANRAPGFDVFLGSGGSLNGYDACQKEKDGDGSSTLTDSDEEYDDDSSMNSFSGFFGNGNDHNSLNKRILELEVELRDVKEKGTRIENNAEDVRARINPYEEELMNVKDKLRLSEGEISKLKIELEKYRSMEQDGIEEEIKMGGEAMDFKTLGEELKMTKEKLAASEMQIASLKIEANKSSESIQQLQDQLELAQKDIATWKTNFNVQKRESTKLQERVARLRTTLADREHTVGDLKVALSDAEQKNFFDRANMKSEMYKILEEKTRAEEKIKEWECHCQSLEEKIRKISFEKVETGEPLKGEVEMLKEEIEGRKKNLEDLNLRFNALKLERDNLKAEVGSLKKVINSRDNKIEEAHDRQVKELNSRIKQLEEETEKQRIKIAEGAEEKREAIRQLCFSLEHFRNGYNMLRQAFMEQKRYTVLAT